MKNKMSPFNMQFARFITVRIQLWDSVQITELVKRFNCVLRKHVYIAETADDMQSIEI